MVIRQEQIIWQEYPLIQLEKLPNSSFYINEYCKEVKNLQKQNRFNREIIKKHYGISLSNLEELCYYNLEKNMDEDGNVMLFYPNMKEVKSSKNRTCCFSGATIRKGSIYVYYRPFLENILNHTSYVLQNPICVELGYQHYLPQTYMDFVNMDKQLQNAPNDFYYDFSVNYGHDTLNLRKLTKKR